MLPVNQSNCKEGCDSERLTGALEDKHDGGSDDSFSRSGGVQVCPRIQKGLKTRKRVGNVIRRQEGTSL